MGRTARALPVPKATPKTARRCLPDEDVGGSALPKATPKTARALPARRGHGRLPPKRCLPAEEARSRAVARG